MIKITVSTIVEPVVTVSYELSVEEAFGNHHTCHNIQFHIKEALLQEMGRRQAEELSASQLVWEQNPVARELAHYWGLYEEGKHDIYHDKLEEARFAYLLRMMAIIRKAHGGEESADCGEVRLQAQWNTKNKAR